MFALKQAETGTAVAEVCRTLGIREATFYSWKKKYGGPSGVAPTAAGRRERAVEADLTLNKQMLQDVLEKLWDAGNEDSWRASCRRLILSSAISGG